MSQVEDWIVVTLFAIFGLLAGNYLGDVATLRNCATKGYAVMVGGGTITCEVQIATP